MLQKRKCHCLVYLKVARDVMYAHEGDDVTYKGEVLKDNNNVTSGPTTGTERAALLEQRPKSGDGSPEVQRQTESMRTLNEFLQVQTQAMGGQALAGAVQHLSPLSSYTIRQGIMPLTTGLNVLKKEINWLVGVVNGNFAS